MEGVAVGGRDVGAGCDGGGSAGAFARGGDVPSTRAEADDEGVAVEVVDAAGAVSLGAAASTPTPASGSSRIVGTRTGTLEEGEVEGAGVLGVDEVSARAATVVSAPTKPAAIAATASRRARSEGNVGRRCGSGTDALRVMEVASIVDGRLLLQGLRSGSSGSACGEAGSTGGRIALPVASWGAEFGAGVWAAGGSLRGHVVVVVSSAGSRCGRVDRTSASAAASSRASSPSGEVAIVAAPGSCSSESDVVAPSHGSANVIAGAWSSGSLGLGATIGSCGNGGVAPSATSSNGERSASVAAKGSSSGNASSSAGSPPTVVASSAKRCRAFRIIARRAPIGPFASLRSHVATSARLAIGVVRLRASTIASAVTSRPTGWSSSSSPRKTSPCR